MASALWVYERGQLAGAGTDTLPNAQALYLPLVSPEGTVGVLAIRPTDVQHLLTTDQRQFLETFASQIAIALARDRLAEEAQHALAQIEAEKLRSSLLSSVSHDLRTPLATIAGASSSLLTAKGLEAETCRELLQTIYEEAERLSRLVDNLLSMTRIESGSVKVNKQWQHIEEVIGTALSRLSRQLTAHPVKTSIAADMSLVPFDGLLLEQVLMNLFDNAAKYSPPGSAIEVRAWIEHGKAIVQVADRGPGLAAEEVERHLWEVLSWSTGYGDCQSWSGAGTGHLPGHYPGPWRAHLGGEPRRWWCLLFVQPAARRHTSSGAARCP